MIISTVCEAIELKYYDVACDVVQNFATELLKCKLPIFDTFFDQFRQSTAKYDAKLYLLTLLMPSMSNGQAEQFLQLIEEVLDEQPENSIFKNNINPIRTGL